MSRTTVIIMWCVAILAMGVWSVFAIRSITECIELEEARAWPTVQGVVTAASVREIRGGKSGPSYRPEIQYTYAAGPDGTAFTGRRIHARSPAKGRRSAAEAMVARFSPGTSIGVHVDPANPASAIVEPGMRSGDWLELALLGSAMLIGVGLVATAWHFGRRLGPGYVAGVRVREGALTRARPESCGALAGGCFTGAIAAFIGCGIGQAFGDFDASWLAGVLGAGLLTALIIWAWGAKSAGQPSRADLVLDYDKELVTTPKITTFKSEVISMAAVTGTAIQSVASFNGKTKTTLYQLHFSDANRTYGPVAAVFTNERNAKLFEAWLREQLALTE